MEKKRLSVIIWLAKTQFLTQLHKKPFWISKFISNRFFRWLSSYNWVKELPLTSSGTQWIAYFNSIAVFDSSIDEKRIPSRLVIKPNWAKLRNLHEHIFVFKDISKYRINYHFQIVYKMEILMMFRWVHFTRLLWMKIPFCHLAALSIEIHGTIADWQTPFFRNSYEKNSI